MPAGPVSPTREPAPDAGFTLVEILVSISLVAVVMTALTMFFVNSLAVTAQQRARQAAIQLASDATEDARGLTGSAVLTGRDEVSTDQQWSSPVTGVAPYLADMQPAWDGEAAFPSGFSAPLPTAPASVTVNGLTYAQHWYVGKCWQPGGGGACVTTRTSGDIELLRVVVAVTWSEKNCTGGTCAYVTSTLVDGGIADPVFNPAETAVAPRPNNPGAQVNEVSAPITPLQLTATGGAPPLTWSGAGLPPGLVVASDGTVSGTPTATGTYNSVTVSVVDAFGLPGSASFTWTIFPGPQPTNPGSRATAVDNPVSLTMSRTGGTGPFTWSVVAAPDGSGGLPAGLSINPDTGVISGTPTTSGPARPVTVQVTDKLGVSGTTTFNWTISSLQAQAPNVSAGTVGLSASVQMSATGGTGPYSWSSAQGLPTGLSMNSAGRISGTFGGGTRFVATVTVTDSTGVTDRVSFAWGVNTASPTGLRVTAPTGDRTDTAGESVSFPAQATGGSGGYTWTASGLPGGVSLSNGTVSGRPGTAGTYVVTLTVRDSQAQTARFMFTWTVR